MLAKVTTTALLLAAGGGSRFAGPTHKLLAMLDGRPVFRHALDHVIGARLDGVVVVTGATDLSIDDDVVTILHNANWQRGQAGSLQIGLTEAAARDSEFVVVGLADQPFIPPAAWRAIAEARSDARIVVATSMP